MALNVFGTESVMVEGTSEIIIIILLTNVVVTTYVFDTN